MVRWKLKLYFFLLSLIIIGYTFFYFLDRLGKAENKISITISCPEKIYKQGDKIPITFIIQNTGKTPFPYLSRFFVRSGRWDEYELTARREDGSVVTDPRVTWWGMCGGPGLRTTLERGELIEKTFALNEWAMISEPGKYIVEGKFINDIYAKEKDRRILVSEPIEIIVEPRTDSQMEQYVNELLKELESVKDSNEEIETYDKLMYTRDWRIVPSLLDKEYKADGEYYSYFAIMYFLPLDNKIKEMVIDKVRSNGLVEATYEALIIYGCDETTMKEFIKKSLESRNYRYVSAAIKGARDCPDNTFVSKLIEIAFEKDNPLRIDAIGAIAKHRTDEGVKALKLLLHDTNDVIKKETKGAIERAYRNKDFYEEKSKKGFQSLYHFNSVEEVISLTKDINSPERWHAIMDLTGILDETQRIVIKAYIDEKKIIEPKWQNDEIIYAMKELLDSPYKDVRDTVVKIFRIFHNINYGTFLKDEDFNDEFKKE